MHFCWFKLLFLSFINIDWGGKRPVALIGKSCQSCSKWITNWLVYVKLSLLCKWVRTIMPTLIKQMKHRFRFLWKSLCKVHICLYFAYQISIELLLSPLEIKRSIWSFMCLTEERSCYLMSRQLLGRALCCSLCIWSENGNFKQFHRENERSKRMESIEVLNWRMSDWHKWNKNLENYCCFGIDYF